MGRNMSIGHLGGNINWSNTNVFRKYYAGISALFLLRSSNDKNLSMFCPQRKVHLFWTPIKNRLMRHLVLGNRELTGIFNITGK
jgi:hypothetical protein